MTVEMRTQRLWGVSEVQYWRDRQSKGQQKLPDLVKKGSTHEEVLGEEPLVGDGIPLRLEVGAAAGDEEVDDLGSHDWKEKWQAKGSATRKPWRRPVK